MNDNNQKLKDEVFSAILNALHDADEAREKLVGEALEALGKTVGDMNIDAETYRFASDRSVEAAHCFRELHKSLWLVLVSMGYKGEEDEA